MKFNNLTGILLTLIFTQNTVLAAEDPAQISIGDPRVMIKALVQSFRFAPQFAILYKILDFFGTLASPVVLGLQWGGSNPKILQR